MVLGKREGLFVKNNDEPRWMAKARAFGGGERRIPVFNKSLDGDRHAPGRHQNIEIVTMAESGG